mmetsp:Transcript_23510/g.26796  ORF Transcript_23510/g.26796 Transcript_23510/m.26796 type:complete len:473 (-) Transcript_23510:101-1519(-)
MSLHTPYPPYLVVIPRFTGSLSAVSSSIIIYLICRSEKKLSTIYHRIMFGMSCTDILSSVALAFTTLPMPKINLCTGEEDYDWGVLRLGNMQTCKAQAFFVRFGVVAMFVYNAMLCCYYTCAIAFGMQENNIRKRVEPLMHVLTIVYASISGILPLFFYPNFGATDNLWCNKSISCNPAEESTSSNNFLTAILPQVLLFGFLIIASFTLIIRKTIRINRELSRYTQERTVKIHQREHDHDNDCSINSEDDFNQHAAKSHDTTKVVIKQALAYILTYTTTLLFSSIQGFTGEKIIWVDYLQAVFFPLQGFFNLLIFIGLKVYNHRKFHQHESYCTILHKLFFGDPKTMEPFLFSRISLVRVGKNIEREENEQDDFEVVIYNEEGNVERRRYKFRRGVGDPEMHSNVDWSDLSENNISSNNLYLHPSAKDTGDDVMIDNDSSYGLSGFEESQNHRSNMTGLSMGESTGSNNNAL